MSMPSFPNANDIPCLKESISAIIASIALEETALSHILNVEGEKIQYMIEYVQSQGYENVNVDALLAVNNSVADVLKSVEAIQGILVKKLEMATQNVSPCPPKPSPSPCTMCCFEISSGTLLRKNATLPLTKTCQNNCDIRIVRRGGESMLVLPKGKSFSISLDLEAINQNCYPAEIIAQFRCDNEVLREEKLVQPPHENVKISYEICYKTPDDCMCNTVVFKLASPEYLSCVVGKVCIQELRQKDIQQAPRR